MIEDDTIRRSAELVNQFIDFSELDCLVCHICGAVCGGIREAALHCVEPDTVF